MAGKYINNLVEKTEPEESDIFAIGNNGGSTLRKAKLSSIINKVKVTLGIGEYSSLETDCKDLAGAVNEVNGKLTDTGWVDIIGTSIATSTIGAPTAGAAVRYRKKNGVVYISGNLKVEKTSGNTQLFTLPAGCRPASMIYTVNTGTGYVMSRYFIMPSGDVKCEWVRKLTDGSDVTGTINWVGIDASFPAD